MALHLSAKEVARLTGQKRGKKKQLPAAEPEEREPPVSIEGATHRLTKRIPDILLPVKTEAKCYRMPNGWWFITALYGMATIFLDMPDERFRQYWIEL